MAQKNDIIQIVRELDNTEIVMIELQGSLEHSIEKTYHDMYLGKLEKTDNEDYTLTIGNHILVGKKTAIKNPYIRSRNSRLVLRQQRLRQLSSFYQN